MTDWLDAGMKREYEGNEWGDAKRQRGTGPFVEIRILLPSKVKFVVVVILCYIFRSIPQSRLNKVSLKCPSIRPQKVSWISVTFGI